MRVHGSQEGRGSLDAEDTDRMLRVVTDAASLRKTGYSPRGRKQHGTEGHMAGGKSPRFFPTAMCPSVQWLAADPAPRRILLFPASSEPTLFAATSGVRARRRRVCDPTQSGSVSKTSPIREIRCAISSPEIRSAWAIEDLRCPEPSIWVKPSPQGGEVKKCTP